MSSNGKPYNILQLVDSELVQKQCYLWECTDRMTDHVIILFDGIPEPNAKGFIGFDESRIAGDLGCFQKDAKLQSQYPAWACFVNPIPSYDKFSGVLRALLSAWIPQADESGLPVLRRPSARRWLLCCSRSFRLCMSLTLRCLLLSVFMTIGQAG